MRGVKFTGWINNIDIVATCKMSLVSIPNPNIIELVHALTNMWTSAYGKNIIVTWEHI